MKIKSNKSRIILRRTLYSAVLLFLYMLMAGGLFKGWQPILIIPLAVAVAMRESEVFASVFGAVCGLVIDLSCDKLFGFSGVWLLPCCLAASLLVSNLIKVNLVNFIWLNAAVCFFMALTDYFFRYFLWRADSASYILVSFTIPSHLSAAILSPLIYFLIRLISNKLSPRERLRLNSFSGNDDDE
jgi:hypothetical protein